MPMPRANRRPGLSPRVVADESLSPLVLVKCARDPSSHAKADVPAVTDVRRALQRWFSENARDLPWRRNRHPWAVWVAEIMLQQTRVEAVVEPYGRFMAAFPTMGALASAPLADVLAQWSGLGYYRRARLLHAGARYVMAQHCGELPRTRASLEKVPGIGAYTAGAILSMAYGQREAALDANVTRVVARLCGVAEWASASGRSEVRRFAQQLVDCPRPGEINEALMDLGSAICTAKSANCAACPLQRLCRGFESGNPTSIAGARARRPARRIELACVVVSDGARTLLIRRPDDDALLGGLWDLPTVETLEGETAPAEQRLSDLLLKRIGRRIAVRDGDRMVRHDIVGRKIVARVYVAEFCVGRGRLPADARALTEAEMGKVGVPALPVKILAALRRREPPRAPAVRGAA